MDVQERGELAKRLFVERCNCCQAVLCAFQEEIGMDKETLLKMGSSFGGGIGGMREVCGAVSGMALVLGLLYGYDNLEDNELKKEHYNLIQQANKLFIEKNGSIICRELLSGEFANAAPAAERTEAYYKKRPCAELVGIAAGIVQNILDNRDLLNE